MPVHQVVVVRLVFLRSLTAKVDFFFFLLLLGNNKGIFIPRSDVEIRKIFLLIRPFTFFQDAKGALRVVAVFGEEGQLGERKSAWGPLFDVEDPRLKVPQCRGKFLDVNQALEVARYDIQYLDWRARQDVLTIMLLHEKVLLIINF